MNVPPVCCLPLGDSHVSTLPCRITAVTFLLHEGRSEVAVEKGVNFLVDFAVPFSSGHEDRKCAESFTANVALSSRQSAAASTKVHGVFTLQMSVLDHHVTICIHEITPRHESTLKGSLPSRPEIIQITWMWLRSQKAID